MALVAKNGITYQVGEFQAGPIEVKWQKRAINPDGDLGRLTLVQEGGGQIELSYPQAITLAKEILRRCF